MGTDVCTALMCLLGGKALNADLNIMSMSAFGVDKAKYEDLIPTMAVQVCAALAPSRLFCFVSTTLARQRRLVRPETILAFHQ